MFVKIDKNGNGTLSFEEFESAFHDFEQRIAFSKRFGKEDVQRVFQAIDSNSNNVIDYSGIYQGILL